MKIFFVSFLSLINFSLYCQSEMKLYKTAKADYNNSEYQQAISNISEAIKIDSINSEYFALRAKCYYALEKDQNAIKDFSKAINLAPTNSNYYIQRGNILCYIDVNKAINDYEKSLKLDSTLYHVAEKCGFIKYNQKDFEGALDFFLISDKYNMSKSGILLNQIADCYYKLNDFKHAIDYNYKILKQLNYPNHPNSYNNLVSFTIYNLGLSYLKLDKKNKACELWTEAIKYGSKSAQKMNSKYCQ